MECTSAHASLEEEGGGQGGGVGGGRRCSTGRGECPLLSTPDAPETAVHGVLTAVLRCGLVVALALSDKLGLRAGEVHSCGINL